MIDISRKTHRTPPRLCLRCGEFLDSATGVDGTHRPKPGNVGVCIKCGFIMIVGDDLVLRAATPEEERAAMRDWKVQAIQWAVRCVQSGRREPPPLAVARRLRGKVM